MNRTPLLAELRRRAEHELRRRELIVDYYRIRQRLSFELPVSSLPTTWPEGIPDFPGYPWMIWLSWALRERWSALRAGFELAGVAEAEPVFRREILALERWPSFRETMDRPNLCTAHLAQALASAHDVAAEWAAEERATLAAVTDRLLHRDALPGVLDYWQEFAGPPRHNIPSILLLGAAELAEAARHPLCEDLRRRAEAWLDHWARLRAETHLTEGTAYDGYLFDAATRWLDRHPDRRALIARAGPPLATLVRQWRWLSIPGRPAEQAPLSDVEPQMPFWITAAARMERLLIEVGTAEPSALSKIACQDHPTDALIERVQHEPATSGEACRGSVELPGAAAHRIGDDGPLAVVSLSRCDMSHLHHDTGHVLLAWRGRCWLSDPGYQQYRKGAERDYCIGPTAHNLPVIAGEAPSVRSSADAITCDARPSALRVRIDLTAMYASSQAVPSRRIVREVCSTQRGDALEIAVTDTVTDAAGEAITTHWHVDRELALSFHDGWARLSDGEAAVWLSVADGPIEPTMLGVHEAARTTVTLTVPWPTPSPRRAMRWRIVCDPAGSFTPPAPV